MIRNSIKSTLAGLTILAFSTSTTLAGGSISFHIQPGNSQDAHLLKTGLGIYSLVQKARKNGKIKQIGRNNSAGIRQNGSGNFGIVHQEGRGHEGTLNQSGHNNRYGLFQFGKNTRANITQHGRGNTGATFIFGW